jgi:hypothetical protein
MISKFFTKIRDWSNSYGDTYHKIEQYHLDKMQKYLSDFSKVEQEYIINYGDWGPFSSQRMENAVNEKQFKTKEEKSKYRIQLVTCSLRYRVMKSSLKLELTQYQDSKKWFRTEVI